MADPEILAADTLLEDPTLQDQTQSSEPDTKPLDHSINHNGAESTTSKSIKQPEGTANRSASADSSENDSEQDAESELDTDSDNEDQLHATTTSDTGSGERTDFMAEVFGVHIPHRPSPSTETGQLTPTSSSDAKPYMAFVQTSLADTSIGTSNSAATTAVSSSVPLEAHGTLVRHGSNSGYHRFKNETPIDRMRRTMRRYSEQSHNQNTKGEDKPDGDISPPASTLKGKREKLRSKLTDAKTNTSAKVKSKHHLHHSQQQEHADKLPTQSPESEAPTIVDKLIDRLVVNALPTANPNISSTDWRAEKLKSQPPFSIQTMSRNFRRMTARTGIAFELIYTVQDILAWKNKWFTVGVWAIYSHLVLNPKLVPAFPFLYLAYQIMAKAYLDRHPPDTEYTPQNPIPAKGPPLADPVLPKPVPELSREFFYNVVDTQNYMVAYIDTYDLLFAFFSRFAYFTDSERTSSLAFVGLLVGAIVSYVVTPWVISYMPWRFVFLLSGWAVAALSHPRYREKVLEPLRLELRTKREHGRQTFRRVVSRTRERVGSFQSAKSGTLPEKALPPAEAITSDSDTEDSDVSLEMDSLPVSNYERIWKVIDGIADKEFDFFEPHEQRQAEVFEIQYSTTMKGKASNQLVIDVEADASTYHWSYSFYSAHPYLPISRGSLVPPTTGISDLTEIQPPFDWEFLTGTHWKLDLSAQAWADSRRIPTAKETGEKFIRVDEETKWVYDKYPLVFKKEDEKDEHAALVEGSEGKKMYIRRRRWTRICTRQVQ